MKIKKIKIKSFRGLKNFECDLDDRINIFTGQNGLGKTTIIDAVMWLLTDETLVNGKDMAGNKNSNNIKDELNVEIELDNGNVLQRIYFDKWKEDLDGNLIFDKVVNDFYINGAKFKKTDYFGFIYDKILHLDKNINIPKDLNLLRCLVDYNYFGNTDYKITRKFLESILNLDNDSEIISKEKYSPIANDMYYLGYDFTAYINSQTSQFKSLSEEITKLEINLEDIKSKYDGDKDEDFKQLMAEFDYENNLTAEDYLTKNSQEYNDLQEEYKKVEEEIKGFSSKVEKFNDDKDRKLKTLIAKGNELNREIRTLEDENNIKERDIVSKNSVLAQIKNELTKVETSTFNEEFCPYCKKSLNENQKNDFEKQKELDLAHLQEELTKITAEVDTLTDKIIGNKAKVVELNKEKQTYSNQYYALVDKKFDSSSFNDLYAQKEDLANKIQVLVNEQNSKKRDKLNQISVEIAKVNDYQINVVDAYNKIETKLKELKVSKATAERNIALAKDFKNEKILSIKKSASKIFPKLEIELLEENPNTGVVKPTLYLKLKGVEYKSINDGHRKLVGIMVIEDLKKALKLPDLPIIFDKYNDVDENVLKEILNTTKAQILTTQVSSNEEIEVYHFE